MSTKSLISYVVDEKDGSFTRFRIHNFKGKKLPSTQLIEQKLSDAYSLPSSKIGWYVV